MGQEIAHDHETHTRRDAHGIAPPAIRLPASTAVGAVRLLVSDLARSIAFYSACSGCRPSSVRRDGARRWRPKAVRRCSCGWKTRPGSAPRPRRGALGLFHFAILLPDRPSLGRFVAHLAAIGAPAGHVGSPGERGDLPERSGRPGHRGLRRPAASRAGRYDDRQLRMATEPLDVRDLVAAGGGQPWTGMPAGTVIGPHAPARRRPRPRRGVLSSRARLRQGGVELPGRAVPLGGRLSPPPRHKHLGAGDRLRRRTRRGCCRGISWCPAEAAIAAARASLDARGYAVERDRRRIVARDPWGTGISTRDDPVIQLHEPITQTERTHDHGCYHHPHRRANVQRRQIALGGDLPGAPPADQGARALLGVQRHDHLRRGAAGEVIGVHLDPGVEHRHQRAEPRHASALGRFLRGRQVRDARLHEHADRAAPAPTAST